MSSRFTLPKSQVVKIIRNALPEHKTMIKSEVTEFCSKAAVVFIMYLTAAANESSKKTIDEERILEVLQEIGFEEWNDDIREAIKEFSRQEKEKKNRKAAEAAAVIDEGKDSSAAVTTTTTETTDVAQTE